MNIRIRKASSADQAFLREMLYRSLYVPEGHEPFSRDIVKLPEIAKYVADWGKSGDVALIANDLENGLSVGAVWLRLLTALQKGYGYVDDKTPEVGIAVLPDYRRRGVGTMLLEQLFRDAESTYQAVSLSVSRNNPAINLYKKLGFESVNEDDNSVVMLKIFSPA